MLKEHIYSRKWPNHPSDRRRVTDAWTRDDDKLKETLKSVNDQRKSFRQRNVFVFLWAEEELTRPDNTRGPDSNVGFTLSPQERLQRRMPSYPWTDRIFPGQCFPKHSCSVLYQDEPTQLSLTGFDLYCFSVRFTDVRWGHSFHHLSAARLILSRVAGIWSRAWDALGRRPDSNSQGHGHTQTIRRILFRETVWSPTTTTTIESF